MTSHSDHRDDVVVDGRGEVSGSSGTLLRIRQRRGFGNRTGIQRNERPHRQIYRFGAKSPLNQLLCQLDRITLGHYESDKINRRFFCTAMHNGTGNI